MKGQIVLSQKINQSISKIDLSSFVNGVYEYVVLNEDGVVLKSDKIIIVK